MQQNPKFRSDPVFQRLGRLVRNDGTIVTTVSEFTAIFEMEMDRLDVSRSENWELVKQVVANQQDLLAYMTNATAQARDQAGIARDNAIYKQKIEAANSSVYILSALIGLKDPQLGERISIVGGSAVKIADAIHNFAGDKALASVILTGNVLGAALNIVGMFKRGPSPEQEILKAIGQIKAMLNQIRMEMHERFDRIDKSLNQIYATMNTRFDQIDLRLGRLQGDVDEIQSELYGIHTDLYRLEGKIFTYSSDDDRLKLITEVNGALNYRAIQQGRAIPQSEFDRVENEFYTWAVDRSKGELHSGSSRPYDDASVQHELRSQPLENNLNYLAEYVRRKFSPQGIPTFAQGRLANPGVWSRTAQAYMELAQESPDFFRQISSNRLAVIYQTGADLQRAITNISLSTSSPRQANRAFFNALIANYRAKATALSQAIADNSNSLSR